MRHHQLFLVALATLFMSCSSGWALPPYLGVRVSPAEDNERGIVVREVTPASPAAKAGLKSGDRVVKMDDQDVTDVEKFLQAVSARKPGDKLNLRIVRDGREQDVAAVLGERPAASDTPFAGLPGIPRPAFLGVQTQALTSDLKKQLKVETDAGVVVTEVVPNSPAAKAGIKPDDVITAVDDRPVKNPEQLREAIQQAPPGKEVILQVMRGQEKLSLKASLREGGFGFFTRPDGDRLPMFDVESMLDQSRRLKDLERRVEELEKRLREQQKK